jgi:aspartate/methionine/tyrosine aminotransferase
MHTLADELNTRLSGTVAGRLLSGLGRRIYFPKGIIAQSAEAKQAAHTANATIGMAYNKGTPLVLSVVSSNLPCLKPDEAVIYAPTAGVESVRHAWKKQMVKKNPSLNPSRFSLPIVVPGITAGISYTADLFLDEGQTIFSGGPCWDNYGLIFRERRGGVLAEIPFFNDGYGLNLDAITAALREAAKTGTVRIILNFPNNPSGYSPSHAESDALIALILEIAEGGTDVLVLCDDAYFGLFYEEDTIKESLFGRLASLHERVLAVKIDGPTKEDYVWGFRMAFVSFGSLSLSAEGIDAIIKKFMGIIRSSVSCTNTPAQYLMLKTMDDPRTAGEKEAYCRMLCSRYRRVKQFIAENGEHPVLKPLPFNSGYFMSFRCDGIDAEALRRELLAAHGIGTVVLEEKYLRIAFAALDEDKIPPVYRAIYQTANDLKNRTDR